MLIGYPAAVPKGEKKTALAKARAVTGLRQEDVAPMLGLKQGTFSRIERHDIMPSTKHLLKLATIYRTSVDTLVRGMDAEYDLSRDLLRHSDPVESQDAEQTAALDRNLSETISYVLETAAAFQDVAAAASKRAEHLKELAAALGHHAARGQAPMVSLPAPDPAQSGRGRDRQDGRTRIGPNKHAS